MNENNATKKKSQSGTELLYDLIEQFAIVSAIVLVMFAFVVRLNIVDGSSMDKTLAHGQNLAVSGLFYEPKAGDIVVIHDVTAKPYDLPIVKRVIATGGMAVLVAEESKAIDVLDGLLTLKGLRIIYEKNYHDPGSHRPGIDFVSSARNHCDPSGKPTVRKDPYNGGDHPVKRTGSQESLLLMGER